MVAGASKSHVSGDRQNLHTVSRRRASRLACYAQLRMHNKIKTAGTLKRDSD